MLYFMSMCFCHFQHQIPKSQIDPFFWLLALPTMGCNRSRICSLKKKNSTENQKKPQLLTCPAVLRYSFFHVCCVRLCEQMILQWQSSLGGSCLKDNFEHCLFLWLLFNTCFTFLKIISPPLPLETADVAVHSCACACVSSILSSQLYLRHIELWIVCFNL